MKGICIYTLVIGLMISGVQLKAQPAEKDIKVSGQVLDDSKQPVAGVHLAADRNVLKNTTGPNGQFKIKIPSQTTRIGVVIATEVFIEVPYDGSSNIVIIIPDSIHENLKAAAPKKPQPATKDYSMYTNIYEVLRTIPGVQVNGTVITIRGVGTSLTNSTEPLFVLNGLVVSTIDEINPGDVESIEVLRGPDTSMYGAKGANGVIVINLKRSKSLILKE